MLIITRPGRPGEKVMLGDDVVIEVIEVSGSSVRIGIARAQVHPGVPGGDLEPRCVTRTPLQPSPKPSSPEDLPLKT